MCQALLVVSGRNSTLWRMEMDMGITETPEQTSEIRLLTDAELDDANGGLIWFAALFAAGLAAGYLAGPSMDGDYNVVLPALGT